MRIKIRNLVVWIVWCLAFASLLVTQWTGWVKVPAWIVVVFGLVLFVFGLVWWAVSWEKVSLRQH
jgi:hypothetical protein